MDIFHCVGDRQDVFFWDPIPNVALPMESECGRGLQILSGERGAGRNIEVGHCMSGRQAGGERGMWGWGNGALLGK